MDPIHRLNTALEGRYRIEQELGEGGMATVYLADDLRHQRKVALKVLKPELAAVVGAERFLAEIRTTANLQHPHILPLHDSGEADGLLFYVMPYVEGESLKERLRREGLLPIEDAVEFTRKLALALHVAHEHGIVHRDVKPGNILLSGDEPLVADFGIALVADSAGDDRLTGTGTSVGTPAYMSPEQSAGEARVDRRSDVYSLGCLLYEMLAGDPPFTGSNTLAVLARKTTEPAPGLLAVRETVPVELERVVLKALQRVPADRFATAADFADALAGVMAAPQRDALQGQPGGASAVDTDQSRPERRTKAWRATLSVAVVLALGLVIWNSFPGRESETAVDSIAVLPLSLVGPDPESRGLDEVVHDRIIDAFYRVSALRTISRTSVLALAGQGLGMSQVGQELDVDVVLEGTLEQATDSVRLRLRLVDTREERGLWSGEYVSDLAGVLEVPDRVVVEVTGQIGVLLSAEERQRLRGGRRVDTAALSAFTTAFADAEARFQQFADEASLRAAVDAYQDAVRADAGFALGWARLSIAHFWMWWWGFDQTPERLAEMERAAEEAVRLDPDLPDVYLAQGWVRSLAGDHTGTFANFSRALELAPGNPDAWEYAGIQYRSMGDRDEALRHLRVASELSRSVEHIGEYAGTLLEMGDLERADSAARRALELRPGAPIVTLILAGVASRMDGDFDRAAEIVRGLRGELPGGTAWEWNALLHALGVLHPDIRDALSAGERPFLGPHTSASRPLLLADIARMTGDRDSSEARFREALVVVDSLLAEGTVMSRGHPYGAMVHQHRALALAGLGRFEEAEEAALQAVEWLPITKSDDFGGEPVLTLARVYTMAGQRELAVARLAELLQHGLVLTGPYVAIHPWFASLRGYPPFEAMVRRFGGATDA